MTQNTRRRPNDATSRIVNNNETWKLIAASERLATEASLLQGLPDGERHEWLEMMMNQIPDYIYAKDRQGRFLIVNHATAREHGFDRAEDLIGKTDFDLHTRQDAQRFFDDEQRVIMTGEPLFDHEEKSAPQRGGERWLMTSKVALRNKQGAVIGVVGASRDITARRKAERLLIGQARLLEMIAKGTALEVFFEVLIRLIEDHLPGVHGSILRLSPDGKQLLLGAGPSLDPAYNAAVHGVAIGPNAGSCGTAAYRNESVFVDDIRTDPLWNDCRAVIAPFGYRSCWSMPIRSLQGQVIGTFALYASKIGLPTGEEQKLVSMAAHLAGIAIERHQSEERIQFMAHHDALTGLPNRMMFATQIAGILQKASANSQIVALAFLDLDHFKLVNDSLGHSAGDALLCIVADRMLGCVRKTDMIVRLGGDEFLILLAGLPADRAIVLSRLQAVRAAIAAPLTVAGRTMEVSCSMGVVCFPEHGTDAGELLANADIAMYRAKELGRNNLQMFSGEMAAGAHAKLLRHEELRAAIAGQQFILHYQPQVDLATGRIFAVEALIRWQHPQRGLVPPGDFIPLAEESGQIVAIGDWVLNETCRQNKAWQDAGLPPIVVSVNVSARQFREKDCVARVAAALDESGLDACYLELELTESLIMQDVTAAVATMLELERLGVALAIDDFGTGYSSLSALKSFPVGRLKIDRSFVKDIPGEEDDMAITAAIISLAQKLQIDVIAEGVETQAQVDFLHASGCAQVQGYFFSRPVPAGSLAGLLQMGIGPARA